MGSGHILVQSPPFSRTTAGTTLTPSSPWPNNNINIFSRISNLNASYITEVGTTSPGFISNKRSWATPFLFRDLSFRPVQYTIHLTLIKEWWSEKETRDRCQARPQSRGREGHGCFLFYLLHGKEPFLQRKIRRQSKLEEVTAHSLTSISVDACPTQVSRNDKGMIDEISECTDGGNTSPSYRWPWNEWR